LIACELAVYGGLNDLWGAAFAGLLVGVLNSFLGGFGPLSGAVFGCARGRGLR
jgi:branched-subunit amino acid ABC-type transport system permease component